MSDQKKAIVTLSKKRYNEIGHQLGSFINDPVLVQQILTTIRNVTFFDPEASQYTQEKGRKMIEQRKIKAAEHGVTPYILYEKQWHDRKKALD